MTRSERREQEKRTARKSLLKERVEAMKKTKRLRLVSSSSFTADQFAELRELLETERAHVSNEIKSIRAGFKSEILIEGERLNRGNHAADVVPHNPAVSESRLANRCKRLAKIDDAIKRLNIGVYGVCQVCEEAIPNQRLLASPATRFCASCKEEQNALEDHANGRNRTRPVSLNRLLFPAANIA